MTAEKKWSSIHIHSEEKQKRLWKEFKVGVYTMGNTWSMFLPVQFFFQPSILIMNSYFIICTRPKKILRSSCIRVNLLSYESKLTEIWGQYDWSAEKKMVGFKSPITCYGPFCVQHIYSMFPKVHLLGLQLINSSSK